MNENGHSDPNGSNLGGKNDNNVDDQVIHAGVVESDPSQNRKSQLEGMRLETDDETIAHSVSQDMGFFSDNTPSPDDAKDIISSDVNSYLLGSAQAVGEDSEISDPVVTDAEDGMPEEPLTAEAKAEMVDRLVKIVCDDDVSAEDMLTMTSGNDHQGVDMNSKDTEPLRTEKTVADMSICDSDKLVKEEANVSNCKIDSNIECVGDITENSNVVVKTVNKVFDENAKSKSIPANDNTTSNKDSNRLDISDKPEEKSNEDTFMDILGNGLLTKKVLESGQGLESRPNHGDTVTLKMKGRLQVEGSQPVTVDDETISFILNDGDVIMALDLGVALMECGETCELVTHHKYAYGEMGRAPDIPACSTITYTLTLLTVTPYSEAATHDPHVRLSLGEAKRERGNYLYGRQDYSGAINSYSKGVKLMDSPELNADLDPSTLDSLTEAWVKCYNNMAACQLKLSAVDAAIRSCEKVLMSQPDNVKALFRLGKAHGARNETDTALAYLRRGLRIDPESKMLHTEVLNLARRRAKQNESEKALYQKMLGLNPADSTPLTRRKDKSSSMMKYVLMASTVAAVAASVGLAWYRAS